MALDLKTVHPARDGTRPMTAEDLWAIPRVGAPVPSPDGTQLAVPVTTYDMEANEGTTRIWLVPTAGGEPRALTSADASASNPSFSPEGNRLAFLRKEQKDGEEKPRTQVYVIPLDGGEAERVAEAPLGAFDARWLPDGSGLVIAGMLFKGHLTIEATAAERDRRKDDPVVAHVTEDDVFRYWDRWLTTGEVPHLFHLDLASGELRDLMPESTDWFGWMDPTGQYDVSPDGGEVAYEAIHFDDERRRLWSSIYRVPLGGGAPEAANTGDVRWSLRPRYAQDGTAIVFGITKELDFYADRVRLRSLDLATGEVSHWMEDWDLTPGDWQTTDDGDLLFTAECDARRHLYRLRKGAAEPEVLLEGGAVGGARPLPGGGACFMLQTVSDPLEVHVLAPGAQAPTRLTRFTDAALEGVALGEVQETTFEGAGGERVQMFVVLPPDHDGSEPAPLVHMIHGGPHGIFGDGFHPRWNAHLFAAPGYVTALVNFQGSTSWGQDFAQRIQGAWGERPFEDVMRATDELIAAGIVDADRMAATGGSYGGYMVSWIAGHTDRFRCIVNHAGVFDTMGMYGSDVPQGRHVSLGGSPWENIETLDRWNPARYAADMNTPMLVVHGERDYRVPASQALLCYSVLKARGVPARLLYYPDENHWVLKPRNSVLWYREVHEWFERWLRVSPSVQ